MNHILGCWLGIHLAIAQSSLIASHAAGDQTGQSVNASDLLKTVQVVGDLGKPLGELTTIRGTWHRVNRKEATAVFRVSHIDEKPASTKIEFENQNVHAMSSMGGPAMMKGISWDWTTAHKGRDTAPKCEHTKEGEVWEILGAEHGDLVSGYSQEFWDAIGGASLAQRRGGYHPGFTFIAMRRLPDKK
jgi:hypothetical protein